MSKPKAKKKIRFEKGVSMVHIPFIPEIGSYRQLFEQMERIKYPKSARRIEASLVISVDLREGETSYQSAEVRVIK